ncbi:extracellular tyrosine-protein kinase PKDCC-like [Physella acuta]|uniref:extracellular tyrosine-protein kinase PKDCC-like n=1 Tax=Physella acuta TaxID=109671 RepID=UPI0027DD0AEC|nr:extracellular tyrosine-protein kinase PKDCC-like [Physella acuta]
MSKIDRLRHEGGFRPALLFNCSSISRMKIRNKIGHGVSKQAFTAEFSGLQFAIKMVTRHIHEVRTCLDQIKQMKIAQQVFSQNKLSTPAFSVNHNDKTNQSNHKSSQHNTAFKPLQYHDNNHEQNYKETHHTSSNPVINDSPAVEITQGERQRCYTYPTARLMKEILLSEQLQHRNLVSLLGYCLRSEESDSTDISEHGVISVYELGSRFVLDNLQILPWQTRLRHAIEMAELLDYLQHSPLGSLIVPDFKEGHLVMVNDSLKLIDLDDVNNLEPECDAMDNKENPCPYNLRCVRALCEGFNAKENLKHMNKLVLKRLLFPLTFPESVVAKIGQLNADLDSLNLSARELRTQLVAIRTRLGQSSSRKS